MMPTMKLRHEISYHAPLAEVFAMLSDPALRQASAKEMGVISADVTITPTGKGIHVHIDQVQPTEGVPGLARKFAGETIVIETPGKPTSIGGKLESLTVDLVVAGMDKERVAGAAWLEGNR